MNNDEQLKQLLEPSKVPELAKSGDYFKSDPKMDGKIVEPPTQPDDVPVIVDEEH